jgi:hypothetical protein
MKNTYTNHQKEFIDRALIELKRRPDKLNQVKENIQACMSDKALSTKTLQHLDQLKWIIESNNIQMIASWLNHIERSPTGYENWALAFKNLI